LFFPRGWVKKHGRLLRRGGLELNLQSKGEEGALKKRTQLRRGFRSDNKKEVVSSRNELGLRHERGQGKKSTGAWEWALPITDR